MLKIFLESETKINLTTKAESENNQLGAKTEEDNNNIELLDYLLSFLENDGELNHVLAGYFSKFMLLLLTKQQKIVKILFNLFLF